jgi:hypothetical protein
MKIKFTDNQGESLSGIEITFLAGGSELVFVTDNEGVVEFFEAKKGDTILCYLNSEDKKEFRFNESETPEFEIQSPLIDMIFVTIGKEEESVTGASVFFEYLGKKLEKISDNTGQILLEQVPVNTKVKVYQLYQGKEHNVEINICKKDKAQYFIIIQKFFEVSDMKFKLVDKTGQVIRNADVRIKLSEKEYETVTDHIGNIKVEGVKHGDNVECRQMIFGKSLPWHRFTCDPAINEYIIHGEKISVYAQNADKFESQVRMRFRLINTKSQPIPNAVLRLEYGLNVRNKYTNQHGEAMIEDVMIGDKIKTIVDIQGKVTTAEFICQKDDEMHVITFKSIKPSVYLLTIPLIIVIAAIVYFASTVDKSNSEKYEEIVVKKDTVIIHSYKFFVKGTKSGKALEGSNIKLIYKDASFTQIADNKGFAKFEAITGKIPKRFEIMSPGYLVLKKSFTLDSLFKVNLIEDDSVEVNSEILPCTSLLESRGKKTTICSFKMNFPKGKFNLWYNLFDLPDQVEVFNGKILGMSDKKLIFSTNGYFTGISNKTINFESADSIITVKIIGNTPKTSWVYKVFCAKQIPAIVQ